MEATAPGLSSLGTIGQIGLTVTDLNRAIGFYRDVMGLKFLFQVPNLGFFDCDGVRLMISGAEKPAEHYGSVIYFKVPDIQQAFQSLAGRGAPFEGEPHLVARMPDHELWMAFFRDPDRNLLALMSEIPHA
jgi:catechol 2,3-dioxygenase-like lactoylglutathione lyase family enzyme